MFREGHYNITLEDLLGGAFYAMDLNNYGRFVSWKDLDEYEHRVGELLESQGHKVWFDLGRNQTSWVMNNYREYFEEIKVNGISGVLLKSEITKDNLANKFTGYLAIPVLLALRDEHCTEMFKKDKSV